MVAVMVCLMNPAMQEWKNRGGREKLCVRKKEEDGRRKVE
jgi:hypothetical protein